MFLRHKSNNVTSDVLLNTFKLIDILCVVHIDFMFREITVRKLGKCAKKCIIMFVPVKKNKKKPNNH